MAGVSVAGQAKSITVGEVVRAGLSRFAHTHRLPAHHWKVLRAIAACHTPALGGHQYRCVHCGAEHFVPHSCGNRRRLGDICSMEWACIKPDRLIVWSDKRDVRVELPMNDNLAKGIAAIPKSLFKK